LGIKASVSISITLFNICIFASKGRVKYLLGNDDFRLNQIAEIRSNTRFDMKDYYYIMGLETGCSQDDVKEVYRKMSKKLHPDLNQGDEYFENRFKDLKEAFDALRDPVKRVIYDAQLQRYKSVAGTQIKQPYRQPRQKQEERPAPPPRPAAAKPEIHRPTTAKPNNPRPEPFRSTTARPPVDRPAKAQPIAARPSTARPVQPPSARSNRSGLAVVFSTSVIIFFIVGGIYIYRVVNSPDIMIKSDAPKVPAAVTAPVKHKHKHSAKNTLSDNQIVPRNKPEEKKRTDQKEVNEESNTRGIVQQPIAVKPGTVKIPVKSDSIVKPHARGEVLYATIVHPNVTGIVQLRAYDAYNANIVASIPANSKVLVLERGQIYYRVCYDKSIGFVPKWALDEQ
jgi:curved DNA-binding protein CbpA